MFSKWESPGFESFVGDCDLAGRISEVFGELGPLAGGEEIGDIFGGEVGTIHEVLRRSTIALVVL